MTKKVTESSGNIFLDLGFPPHEAEVMLLRAKLAQAILLLPCGGDRTTQQEDIDRARAYLEDDKDRATKRSGTCAFGRRNGCGLSPSI